MRDLFEAATLDDEATLAAMGAEYRRSGTLLDPHTAVGLTAGRMRTVARETPLVALATAHPAKFPEAVERATGISPPLPPALADLHDRPERSERVAAERRRRTASRRARRRGLERRPSHRAGQTSRVRTSRVWRRLAGSDPTWRDLTPGPSIRLANHLGIGNQAVRHDAKASHV